MSPHQERVITEKTELDDKRTKLAEFIKSNPVFDELHPQEQLRMHRQLQAMELYSDILGERIEAFTT